MPYEQLHPQTDPVPLIVEVVLKGEPSARRLGLVLRQDAGDLRTMVIILQNGWTVLGEECYHVEPIGTTTLPALVPNALNELFLFLRGLRQIQEGWEGPPSRGMRFPVPDWRDQL